MTRTKRVTTGRDNPLCQIVDKIRRELDAAGRLADTVLRSRDNLNSVLDTLNHLSSSLLPELLASLAPVVPDPAPCTLPQIVAEFNRRGITARVESAPHPGASNYIHVRVSYAPMGANGEAPFVDCEWFWWFDQDGPEGTWSASLFKAERSDREWSLGDDGEPQAFMQTDVSIHCAAAIEVVDGFLRGRVIRANC